MGFPRSSRNLRPYLTAALTLIFLPIIYLSNAGLPSPARLVGHKHALEATDDLGLAFPNDPVPRRDFSSLSHYPAHNINEPSKYAFATFYCTRSPDTRGPYFESTQSIIWRILWSGYRSKYPVIVFVCPFIPEKNRQVFRGQGAIVKEIELLDDIIPDESITTKRWIDVLSKLNVWKEIDWKRIVLLDADAFPARNIDDIFDLVPEQRCKEEMLSPIDKAFVDKAVGEDNMCNYVYGGVPQFQLDNINAGMLVLKPNLDMHAKLLRAARSKDGYKAQDMEQGILKSKYAFSYEGPFPVHRLPAIWNADPEYYIDYLANGLEAKDGPIRVLHQKMWNRMWGGWNNLTVLNDMWDLDWMNMCRFFDDVLFEEARMTGIFKSDLERWTDFQAELKQKEDKEEKEKAERQKPA